MNFKALFFAVYHRARIIMILLPILTVLIPFPAVHAVPSAFSILSPKAKDEVSAPVSVPTEVLLDWEDSTDPIHPDGLTYTVILSKGDDSFAHPIRIMEIVNSCHLIEGDDELEDGTTYYWKVQAVNEYGDFFETEPRYFKTDNNTNPERAWIGGHVYSSVQNNPINNIIIRVLNLWDRDFSFIANLMGRFLAELDPENFTEPGMKEEITMEINVEGCIPKIISPPLEITRGELTEIGNIILDFNGNISEDDGIHVTLEFDGNGDINGDDGIDLKDAVLALQILADEQPSEDIHKEAALGEDEKIDMEELIYILQKIVSPSPCTQKDQP